MRWAAPERHVCMRELSCPGVRRPDRAAFAARLDLRRGGEANTIEDDMFIEIIGDDPHIGMIDENGGQGPSH